MELKKMRLDEALELYKNNSDNVIIECGGFSRNYESIKKLERILDLCESSLDLSIYTVEVEEIEQEYPTVHGIILHILDE